MTNHRGGANETLHLGRRRASPLKRPLSPFSKNASSVSVDGREWYAHTF